MITGTDCDIDGKVDEIEKILDKKEFEKMMEVRDEYLPEGGPVT